MTADDAADLQRQWEAAVDRAWLAVNGEQAKEAMEEEARLWDLIVGQTPKAEGSDLGLRASGSGETDEPKPA